MAPTLYLRDISPFTSSVLLTAKAIRLNLNLRPLDFFKNEHLTPEFLKINPQHTVPTLDDDGYYIWDSHAIIIYLVRKYAKDDSLYPNDAEKQGVVNQRLFFSASVLEDRMIDLLKPVFFGYSNIISEETSDLVREAYDFLEKFLEGHNFVAGDSLTIADFSIVAVFSMLGAFVSVAKTKNPLLFAWFERMKKLPYYAEVTKVTNDQAIAILRKKLALKSSKL